MSTPVIHYNYSLLVPSVYPVNVGPPTITWSAVPELTTAHLAQVPIGFQNAPITHGINIVLECNTRFGVGNWRVFPVNVSVPFHLLEMRAYVLATPIFHE